MFKKINIIIIAFLIAVNAYGAIVISTYRKPKKIKYKYKLTERGKVLIVPKDILFDFNSSSLDLEKYFKTLKYVGDVTSSTNIIDIIIEGHSSSDEIKKRITNIYGKKDILFLYNRRNLDELSYQRSYNVFLSITNGDTSKLTNYGLYDLVNEYKDIKKNRRVEFILIENTNDMNIYTNYINKLIMSNL